MKPKKNPETISIPELLSPAGSFESLMAAIQGGCDAVYFGVEQLNMRARSVNNFTIEDLQEISGLAKKHRIKTYLTLNTVLYDHDIRLMRKIIQAAKKSGIDAVIASDIAAMTAARELEMPVHISTQANVSNLETVKFYSAFADVVVLARELALSQVKQITTEIARKKIKGPSGQLMRIEIFVHGALCMAVSGKCYLSLHSHNASANRGACVQNCRKAYVVTDKDDGHQLEIENEYIMSASDLCTIDFLDKIMDAGVNVFKIEGRGRAPEYVYTVTKCYREAIDAISRNEYTPEKIEEWKTRLKTVFNRDFWDGYYLGRTMGQWSDAYGSKATEKKIYIGHGLKYYPNAKAGEFMAESHTLAPGSKVIITGPQTGVLETVIQELRVNNIPVSEVKKGDVFTIALEQKIRKSDKLYKMIES